MRIDKSRRDFFTKDLFTETIRFFNEIACSYKSRESAEGKEDYFESFEKCYPLISEAGEMLMEEAVKHGIQTEGKSKPEIAREIFAASGNSGRGKRR